MHDESAEVKRSVGEIIPLKYNDKLTTYADLLPNRIDKTQDNTLFELSINNTPIWFNYWNGDVFVNNYIYQIPKDKTIDCTIARWKIGDIRHL